MTIPFERKCVSAPTSSGRSFSGVNRYPLVLMLEPLFRCNLACVGCGKIDYPDPILNQRLVGQGMPRRGRRVRCAGRRDSRRRTADPQGDRRDRRRHRRAQEVRVRCAPMRCSSRRSCTCSSRRPYLFFFGPSGRADRITTTGRCRRKAYSTGAVKAIKAARQGLHASTSTRRSSIRASPEDIARFPRQVTRDRRQRDRSSPGYAYERAPDQEHFLSRRKTKELFRRVFELGKGKNGSFIHSSLYLDFLAGNQEYHCTPWGMPTRKSSAGRSHATCSAKAT